MNKTVRADKILMLGIDGLDPSLTKKFMDQGKLPNFKKIIDRGAQREDLRMLGAMPTITPPLWTTLATGAYPNTHGITCFWNQSHEDLDTMVYAFSSTSCKAEQLWNVFAESGRKTLVWHWPGSSWPPSSESDNLYVVDGTQPGNVNMGNATIDWEKMIVASVDFKEVLYKPKAANDNGAGCVLTDVTEEDESGAADLLGNICGGTKVKSSRNIMFDHSDGELALDKIAFDIVNSPLKDASGWVAAPADAKEFVIVTSEGYVRRPALLLKNAQGIYDQVAVYKSKKDTTPVIILEKDVMMPCVIDDVLIDGEHKPGSRNIRVLDIAPDGSRVRIWMGNAMDISNDHVWHPHALYKEVVENVGYVPMIALAGAKDPHLVEKVILPCWNIVEKWQASALNYLIEHEKFDVVFSHIHNVDSCGHFYWYFGKEREALGNDEAIYQQFIEDIYVQTDAYIGQFLHLLDKGWTIFIMSDHGLMTTQAEHPPLIGDAFGCNIRVMEELGYTVLKRDADGQELREIDWEKTKAVATRGGHIWINLKGRNKTGIVDPKDKYELEREIITALYGFKEPHTGLRAISIAMRNKDAAVIGMSGSECGDIIYFLEEGFNRLHGDSLSTSFGYKDTSVSPIFIAAGKGLKQGYTTDRVIREVDFAATVAYLGGVKMPAQCEGAPVYQIIAE